MVQRFAACPRDRGGDVRQVDGFVPPRLGFRGEVPWQQIGAVGFDDEPIRCNLLHEGYEMGAAALIADPPGDADVQIHVLVSLELLEIAREAMSDAADERAAVFAEDGHEVPMRIPLVQEDRLTDLRGQLELAMKCFLLHGARRKVPEIVQSAFSDGDHLLHGCELTQLHQQLLSELFGVVRMDARRGKQHVGMRTRHFDSLAGALAARSSHDHLHYTSGHGT